MHKTSDLIKDNETVSQEIRRVAHEPSVDVDVDASTRRNLLPKLGRPSIAVESLERTCFFLFKLEKKVKRWRKLWWEAETVRSWRCFLLSFLFFSRKKIQTQWNSIERWNKARSMKKKRGETLGFLPILVLPLGLSEIKTGKLGERRLPFR